MSNFGASNFPTEKMIQFATGANKYVPSEMWIKTTVSPELSRLLFRLFFFFFFFSTGAEEIIKCDLATILGNEGKGALRFVVGCFWPKSATCLRASDLKTLASPVTVTVASRSTHVSRALPSCLALCNRLLFMQATVTDSTNGFPPKFG